MPSIRPALCTLAVALPLLFGSTSALRAHPAPGASGGAAEPVDLEVVTQIRDEGFRRSQVMETVTYLSDVLGPRLTGSPQYEKAAEWTRDTLAEWGLKNAHLEAFDFGRGWSFRRASVHLVEPRAMPLPALPRAWTLGTEGPARGQVMRVSLESEEDLQKQHGKLKGKILLLDPPVDVLTDLGTDPLVERYDSSDLSELESFEIPEVSDPKKKLEERSKRFKLREKARQFLIDEGVLATIEASSRLGGVLRVTGGGSREMKEPKGVTGLIMGAEAYNSLVRMTEAADAEVELEIEVEAQFHEENPSAHNVLAEIPGRDPRAGVVMVGAHLDSWHTGTGATDNAAGCAVVMEAVRILQALDLQPRRTLRIALWGGEEQGLLGSRAYVAEHFGNRPLPTDPTERDLPEWMWSSEGRPLRTKPEHRELSAYFNLDNGGGRIRGIYAEGNSAAAAIFQAWLSPFHDLGAETVTLNSTGATDHVPFDRVGLPGFQFIQDGLSYRARTHHSYLDVVDYLYPDDLKQSAVILASFLYHAAERMEPLPRKPLREEPRENEERASR